MPLLHEWVHHDILKIWSTWTVKINTQLGRLCSETHTSYITGSVGHPWDNLSVAMAKIQEKKPKCTRVLGLGFELVHYFSCVLSTPLTRPGWDQRGRGFSAYLGKCILTTSSHLRWLREVASLVDTGGGGGPCNPFVSYVLEL